MSLVTKLVQRWRQLGARPSASRPPDERVPPLTAEDLERLAGEGDDQGLAEPLRHALAEGLDLNDWLERQGEAVNVHQLERTTIRFLNPSSWVLELGPGSGRYSRHLVKYLTQGQLHLVDPLPWKVSFLRRYFQHDARIHVHRGDGYRLPEAIEAFTMDMVCSFETFQYLRLGQILHYAHEIFRVLKPGGVCVFDFLDITTEAGWRWLENNSDLEQVEWFSYFTPATLERVMQAAGLEPVPDCPVFNNYSYLVFRKPLHFM